MKYLPHRRKHFLITGDVLDAYTVLLVHCNGPDGSIFFHDNGVDSHVITRVGGAQVDTAQKVFGTGSLLCSSAGDCLSVPDHADWDFGTGDFTIDFRVRFNAHSGEDIFLDQWGASRGWQVIYDSVNDWLYMYNSPAAGDALFVKYSWNPSLATWYHVAVVRASGVITMYVDGTALSVVSSANADQDITGSSAALGIGDRAAGTAYPFNGWMDEIRISKGKARWTGNFTPSTAEYYSIFHVYVCDFLANSYKVIETDNNTVVNTTACATGPFNGTINVNGEYVYIANYSTANCKVVQTSDMSIIATVNLGTNPRCAVCTPDGAHVYVTNQGSDNVSVIQTSDNTVSATVTVGDAPINLGITPSGNHVYVSNNTADTISVIQTSDNTVSATISSVDGPRSINFTLDGSLGYVALQVPDNISIIQTSDNTVIDTISVGNTPIDLKMTPDGNYVYVCNYDDDTVSVIQTSDDTVIATVSVGDGPSFIDITPNGAYAYVSSYSDDRVKAIRTSDNVVVATITVGDGPRGIIVAPN